mmetsp:Transcript_23229/g.67058  ORF Transcript_23229/g.67058 Transcript_23229/m.67058 type:complete len:91 (-) Transcript_23229:27-299(-)
MQQQLPAANFNLLMHAIIMLGLLFEPFSNVSCVSFCLTSHNLFLPLFCFDSANLLDLADCGLGYVWGDDCAVASTLGRFDAMVSGIAFMK